MYWCGRSNQICVIRLDCHGALQVPWNSMNSMELFVPSKLAHYKFHGIDRVIEIGATQVPWNSVEQLVSSNLAHPKFHGVPWNCSCHRNWHSPSSIEFHGTARVIEIGALQVPWNSMELLVSAKLAHSKFHGIPWICSYKRNWCNPSSMELLVSGPWNSMESLCLLFNGTIGIINTLSFKFV